MAKRDYREKTVEGVIFKDFKNMSKCLVTVRMTSNYRGQSLSLENNGTMIVIPLEEVKDIIRVTESKDIQEDANANKG